MQPILLYLAALCAGGSPPAADAPPVRFGIGDAPPPLALGDFVKGTPFKAFQPGTVYVVEFWATWCKPCLDAMPHFNELQKANPKVVFLWVDVWDKDQAAVKEFVTRMGDKMNFAVALDSGCDADGVGAMAKTWLPSFGGKGLPSTVIVDGTGKVAWMGAPNKLDAPLKAVVDGTWDVAVLRPRHQAAGGRRIDDSAIILAPSAPANHRGVCATASMHATPRTESR